MGWKNISHYFIFREIKIKGMLPKTPTEEEIEEDIANAKPNDIVFKLCVEKGLIEVTKSERPEVEKAYQEALQILTNHDEIVSLRQHMDEQMQRLDSLRNKLEVHLGSLQSEVKEFDTSTKGSEEET